MHIRIPSVVAAAAALVAAFGLNPVAASADPTAVISMPKCCVADTVAVGGSVFALDHPSGGGGPEQSSLVRIDPSTNTVTGSTDLLEGTATGNALDTEGLAVVAGSIWVPAYWENEVLRIDPVSMAVTASIPVGRSPGSVATDGRSLWVALQNQQSVVRVDPARNLVVQTVHVGSRDSSDSPFQLAFDGSQILASMPVSGRVARIDPSTGKVHYDAVGTDAAACARILPVSGGYWLDDTECSPSYYRWDAHKQRITVNLDPTSNVHHDWGAVVVGSALYTGEFDCGDSGCTQGVLVKRDLVTGAEISQQGVGIEALLPHYAAGSFWVADFDDGTLQRVAAF